MISKQYFDINVVKPCTKLLSFVYCLLKTINFERVIGYTRTLVGYQSPGSWSETLFHTVAKGNSRNAFNRVTSHNRGTFYVKVHAVHNYKVK